jgi:GntR family transcriptional repressor for pyruvate dehydrogenase complex
MRVLVGEIAAGTYAEGDMLPRESDIAAQFDVSRGVARECLRGLEERGLVKVRHGRGAMVTPAENWDRFDSEVLAALLRSTRAADVLGEYLECRRILEVEAAGLAAERAAPEALQALSDAFQAMCDMAERARENAAAEEFYREADVNFHRAVIRAARNPMLGRMTEPIHRALTATFGALSRPQLRFERGLPEHERVLDAIRVHDVEGARQAMREHLVTVEGYLRDYTHRQAEELHAPVGVLDPL